MFSVQGASNYVAHAPESVSMTEHFQVEINQIHLFLLNLCRTTPDTVFHCQCLFFFVSV